MTTIAESDEHTGLGIGMAGHWREPAVACLVFVVIQLALVVGGITPVLDGELAEPDAYMRLNRVAHLWQSGDWFDAVFPRIGAPDGHIQHWTRPLDALLLLGALVASPFVGFDAGLHWWGVLIGPVLLLPTVFALVWAAMPLVRRDSLWLVGMLFVVQPGILLTFLAGRPDQNCLLILLFVLTLGLSIRMLLQPERLRLAALAGVVATIALWVSVETMMFIVAAIAIQGFYWLRGERSLAKTLVVHAAALFVSLLVALFLERGLSRFGLVEFDMISIAHLQLFALNLLYWAALMLAADKWQITGSLPGRAVMAAVSALAVFAVIWWIQPGFFESPFAMVDDLYRNVRLINIDEFQPVVGWSTLSWDQAPAAIGTLVLWLGMVLIAAPCLVHMIVKRRGIEGRGWVLLAGLTAIFVPFTLLQIRWVAYAEILMIFPYAAAIGLGLRRIDRWRMPDALRAVPRAFCVSFACVWMFAPAALAGAGAASTEPVSEPGPVESAGSCPLTALSAFLADPEGLGGRQLRVMAFVDFGPELLYRTPHSVYSIPNHRYQPGFTATYRIMTADSAPAALSLIRGSQVELIVICPNWPVEAGFYGGESRNADGFYNDLAAGENPDTVTAVRLPDHLNQHFRLYSVGASR